MENLIVALTEEQAAFVREESARVGHATTGEYLRALIDREQERRRAKRELDAKLLEGLQGSAVMLDRAEWDSMRRDALEGLAGKVIRP